MPSIINGKKSIPLVNEAGQYIGSTLSTDGDYHLNTNVIQSVLADANNSSTTNLTAANSYTFTGAATSTLGVVGLQWALKTDQNATVYVDESPDGTNWDISYDFDHIALAGGRGETVQATQAFWRIRVILTGTTDTTYFRLSGVLCPIATPLPSALSPDGRLLSESTITGQQNANRHVWVAPDNTLGVFTNVRLVGTNFDGTTKDPNFWTTTTTNGGTVTQSGEIELNTNTTADGTAQYDSVRRARFVVGSALQFQAVAKFVTAGTADNVRRLGAYDDNDGFYFELDGSTFSVGFRNTTVDTLVSSGSFNGNYGSTYTMNTSYHKFAIEWSPRGVFFYIDGILLHKDSQGHRSSKLSLPIRFENNNDNSNDTEVVLDVLAAATQRLGSLITNPTYYHISGNAATHVLKYGPGTLQKIVFNNTSGTSITIYDNTAGSGDVIGVITTTSGAIGSWEYNCPFSVGLTLVTVGNSLDATIVYE